MNAERFKSAIRRIRAPSGRQKHSVAQDLMRAVRVLIENGLLRDLPDPGVQMKFHTVFLVGLHQQVTDLQIGRPGDLRHHFNDDHPGTDRGKIACHFKTDHTAADAAEDLRLLRQLQNFAVRHHKSGGQPVLYAGDRRDHRSGACCKDQMLRLQRLFSGCDEKSARRRFSLRSACSAADRHAVCFHGGCDTADEPFNDLIFPLQRIRM